MIESSFLLTNDWGWPIRGEVRRDEAGGAAGLVVVSHGFKGFKDWGFFPWLSRRLAEAGFTVITFNFSGSGIGSDRLQFTELDKFRENTFTREIGDLEQVLMAALGRELPDVGPAFERGPALLGHSRGGLDSLYVATTHPEVKRVVTWAGMTSLKRRFDPATRADWRKRGFLEVLNARTGQVFEVGVQALEDLEHHEKEYDPLISVSRLSVPLLMVHGSEDPTIPLFEARELFERARPGSTEFVDIPGSGHTFDAAHPFTGPTPALERAIDVTRSFLLK